MALRDWAGHMTSGSVRSLQLSPQYPDRHIYAFTSPWPEAGPSTAIRVQVLDEPAAVQSDPTVLNLQLRALGKEAAGVKMQVLGAIPHNAPDR